VRRLPPALAPAATLLDGVLDESELREVTPLDWPIRSASLVAVDGPSSRSRPRRRSRIGWAMPFNVWALR
jgi:hypothetical protein